MVYTHIPVHMTQFRAQYWMLVAY